MGGGGLARTVSRAGGAANLAHYHTSIHDRDTRRYHPCYGQWPHRGIWKPPGTARVGWPVRAVLGSAGERCGSRHSSGDDQPFERWTSLALVANRPRLVLVPCHPGQLFVTCHHPVARHVLTQTQPIDPIGRAAGLATTVPGSTSCVTIAPAAIIAPSPIVTPFKMIARQPIQTRSPMRTGAVRGA